MLLGHAAEQVHTQEVFTGPPRIEWLFLFKLSHFGCHLMHNLCCQVRAFLLLPGSPPCVTLQAHCQPALPSVSIPSHACGC